MQEILLGPFRSILSVTHSTAFCLTFYSYPTPRIFPSLIFDSLKNEVFRQAPHLIRNQTYHTLNFLTIIHQSQHNLKPTIHIQISGFVHLHIHNIQLSKYKVQCIILYQICCTKSVSNILQLLTYFLENSRHITIFFHIGF